MGKFKKGLFLGGILGAALTWINTTTKGREFREKLLDQSAVIYAEVKERALASDTWETMQKNEYVRMVQDAVDKYAKEHELADDVRKMIVKLVSSQWKNLRRGK